VTARAVGTAKASRAQEAWRELSERQRGLLSSAYGADQAAEARELERHAEARRSSPYARGRPAAEWRWMNQDTARGRLRSRGSDTADFAALQARGLVDVDTGTGRVRMTRAGRAAVRAGTGAPPPPRIPKGLLSEWSWAALARLHAAGDGGLVLEAGTGRAVPWWERCPPWNTVARLGNRAVPYAEELKVNSESCVRLTPPGREHVDANRDRYRAAYPDAPEPGPRSPEALHRGDPEQLSADAGHRHRIGALAEAEIQARTAGDHDGAALLRAELLSLCQPSACGHWPGTGRDPRLVSLGNQAAGAPCRQPGQEPGGSGGTT
jgi:hypothetical protein